MSEADQEADARRGVGDRRSGQAKQELWGGKIMDASRKAFCEEK